MLEFEKQNFIYLGTCLNKESGKWEQNISKNHDDSRSVYAMNEVLYNKILQRWKYTKSYTTEQELWESTGWKNRKSYDERTSI